MNLFSTGIFIRTVHKFCKQKAHKEKNICCTKQLYNSSCSSKMKKISKQLYLILPFLLLDFKEFLMEEKGCNASLDLDHHIQLMPATQYD